MSAITRTVQSTATKEVSSANYNGWDLTFTTEIGGPYTNVSVHGQKDGAYLNANANSDGHVNVNFSQGGYDSDVATAVAAEMESILNPAE